MHFSRILSLLLLISLFQACSESDPTAQNQPVPSPTQDSLVEIPINTIQELPKTIQFLNTKHEALQTFNWELLDISQSSYWKNYSILPNPLYSNLLEFRDTVNQDFVLLGIYSHTKQHLLVLTEGTDSQDQPFQIQKTSFWTSNSLDNWQAIPNPQLTFEDLCITDNQLNKNVIICLSQHIGIMPVNQTALVAYADAYTLRQACRNVLTEAESKQLATTIQYKLLLEWKADDQFSFTKLPVYQTID